jgi:hypothetical protein
MLFVQVTPYFEFCKGGQLAETCGQDKNKNICCFVSLKTKTI